MPTDGCLSRRLASSMAVAWARSVQPELPAGWRPGADFWAIVAEICLQAEDAEAALTAIDRALAREPEQAVYHHNRAAILLALGREDEARAALAEARRLVADHTVDEAESLAVTV